MKLKIIYVIKNNKMTLKIFFKKYLQTHKLKRKEKKNDIRTIERF